MNHTMPDRFILIILFVLSNSNLFSAQNDGAGSAIIYKSKIIFIDDTGHLSVWNCSDDEFDKKSSLQYSKVSATHIASDGANLWSTDNSSLYSWSQDKNSWKKESEFVGGGEDLKDLVVVGGKPLLVFPSKIDEPTGGHSFKAPKLDGYHQNPLRIFALYATNSMLWIGTGQGEWGGNLVGLNPQSGKWVQYFDDLHYVTGITQANPNEIIVSWSMSHFRADTLIRIHNLDGTQKVAYANLETKYFQKIAYSTFDKILYGVEGRDLVQIANGNPSKIVEIETSVFEREPLAIGVAPGIAEIIPLEQKTVVVVPRYGATWKLKDAKLLQYKIP